MFLTKLFPVKLSHIWNVELDIDDCSDDEYFRKIKEVYLCIQQYIDNWISQHRYLNLKTSTTIYVDIGNYYILDDEAVRYQLKPVIHIAITEENKSRAKGCFNDFLKSSLPCSITSYPGVGSIFNHSNKRLLFNKTLVSKTYRISRDSKVRVVEKNQPRSMVYKSISKPM